MLAAGVAWVFIRCAVTKRFAVPVPNGVAGGVDDGAGGAEGVAVDAVGLAVLQLGEGLIAQPNVFDLRGAGGADTNYRAKSKSNMRWGFNKKSRAT